MIFLCLKVRSASCTNAAILQSLALAPGSNLSSYTAAFYTDLQHFIIQNTIFTLRNHLILTKSSQIGITGLRGVPVEQTGTNWDTEMVSIWSLIPVSAWWIRLDIAVKTDVSPAYGGTGCGSSGRSRRTPLENSSGGFPQGGPFGTLGATPQRFRKPLVTIHNKYQKGIIGRFGTLIWELSKIFSAI